MQTFPLFVALLALLFNALAAVVDHPLHSKYHEIPKSWNEGFEQNKIISTMRGHSRGIGILMLRGLRVRLRGGEDEETGHDNLKSRRNTKRSFPESLPDHEEGGHDSKKSRQEDVQVSESFVSARPRGEPRQYVSLGDSLPSDIIDHAYDELERPSVETYLRRNDFAEPPARGTWNFTEMGQEESAINMSFPEGSVFVAVNETAFDPLGLDGANRALVSDQSTESEESVVNVDFEMFDPIERDRYYLLSLLNFYMEGKDFDAAGMIDTIIEQGSRVGTVQRIANSTETYGFITCLNLHIHKEKEWVKQILSFVRSKCKVEQLPALERIIGPNALANNSTTRPPRIGLIVSERVPNMPHSLAAPLINSLFDELAWARGEKDEGEGGQASVGEAEAVNWVMDYYLALTCKILPGTKLEKGVSRDKKDFRKGLSSPVDAWGSSIAAARGDHSWETSAPGGVDLRPKPEDQAFGEVAELKITYPLSNDFRTTMQFEKVTRLGEIYFFPVSKEPEIRKRVLELAGDDAVKGQSIDDASYVWRDGRFH